jgi:hypothetical protein
MRPSILWLTFLFIVCIMFAAGCGKEIETPSSTRMLPIDAKGKGLPPSSKPAPK